MIKDLELLDKNAANLRQNKETAALKVSREHYLFLSDYINRLQNALLIEQDYSKSEKGWRCFYCDLVFVDHDEARKHFSKHDTHLQAL